MHNVLYTTLLTVSLRRVSALEGPSSGMTIYTFQQKVNTMIYKIYNSV